MDYTIVVSTAGNTNEDFLTALSRQLPKDLRAHTRRVATVANVMAEQAEKSELMPYTHSLWMGGFYHHIGETLEQKNKEQIPLLNEQILRENADLLAEEQNTNVDIVLDIARHHCERVDGSGYPDGLCGNAVSLAARLVGIADKLDQFLSDKNGSLEDHVTQTLQYMETFGESLFGKDAIMCFDNAKDEILDLYLNHKKRIQDWT